MSKVTFIKSEDRKYNIDRALSLIKSEIMFGVRQASRIVIVPSCPSENKNLCTSSDALESVLSMIEPHANSQVSLAGGNGLGTILKTFKNCGYFNIQDRYGFAIIDLDCDDFKEIELIDKEGRPKVAHLPRSLTDSDYLISLALPRTDCQTIFSGVIQNISSHLKTEHGHGSATGFLERLHLASKNKLPSLKSLMIENENIWRTYNSVSVKLAILDGYIGFEANGPKDGVAVENHYAIVSSDPVAADLLACKLMDINPGAIGYLSALCKDTGPSLVSGDLWQDFVRQYQLPDNFKQVDLLNKK